MTPAARDLREEPAETDHTPALTDDAGLDVPGPALVAMAIGAVVIGVALRFVARTPLWLDEALSVNIAALPLSEIADALRQDGHPPLYYVLLHAWMELFGHSDVAVRALSGVIAVATLPLAWLAGRRRGGPVLAWLTLAVLALSPYALRYATETRMYALMILLWFAGYLLIDGAVRDGRDGLAPLAGIALLTTALLYTHYWSLWLVAATAVVVAWTAWRGHDRGTRHSARRVLAALVIGGLFFVPWLGVLADQAAHTGTPWAGPQRPTSMVAGTLTDFGGGDFLDAELGGAVLLVLLLLGLFGRAVDGRRIMIELRTVPQLRTEAIVGGLTLLIGAVVGYLTVSAWATRYAAVFFGVVVLLVAAGISRFAGRGTRLGVLAVVLVFGLLGGVYNVREQRSQARAIADAVAAHAQPGDVVVYCPDQLGPAGAREMPGDVVQVVYPTLAPPDRVDWRDYEQRNAAADPTAVAEALLAQAGPTAQVFVAWSGGYATFNGQCEALVSALAGARGGAEVLVGEDTAEYYEHAQLVRIGAAS